MTQKKEFNPIEAARRVEKSYREYIAATIHFADSDLQGQLESILSKRSYLAKGPILEAAPPYLKDKTVAELVDEGILCKSMMGLGGGDIELFDPYRPLYVHQVRAIRKAIYKRNYVVVTGTGSGKTECFLLPIFNDILKEFEEKGPSAGVRAMILYPMNALANDQLKRLRMLLKGTDITFGRYTGDTEETRSGALRKWKEENPDQIKLPNEIISREEIRENPPNILLTNYSMLEYLLLRPEDAPLFSGAFGVNWRHIAIDEAHVYSGALGTEIAYLLRRLKARIESNTGRLPELHCYATSATIGSEDEMPKVAMFAQGLFGEPFSSKADDLDVVTSVKDRPEKALDETPWGTLSLTAWTGLRKVLYEPEAASGHAIREVLATSGVPEDVLSKMEGEHPLLGLGKILLGEESTNKLVRRCKKTLDLTDLERIRELEIDGLTGDDKGAEILTAMVEVLSSAQRSKDVPILTSRYHSFLRAPEGIFLNLRTRKLTPNKTVAEKYDESNDTPVYEVSVCRHCGQAYILGIEEPVQGNAAAWLNPRHEGTDADDEFLPRTFYRLLDDESERDSDENVQWLCPICGSLHHEADGGLHRFVHEVIRRVPLALNQTEGKRADEATARCRHCGYKSPVAIQSMRVSPEAAGSVVCYDLVREIPPFEREEPDEDDWFTDLNEEHRAGSVICFSDKRQDAAFFAPAMERTYNSITRRQLIREAVEAKSLDGEGCKPSAVVNWIASTANERYPGLLCSDKRGQATAWILDELASEDSRNSLEGLGILRIEPAEFNKGFLHPKVKNLVTRRVGRLNAGGIPWITEKDYVLFVKVCLELLRERNVIEVPEGVPDLRTNREKRGNYVILGGGETPSFKDAVQFAGTPTSSIENKRSAFIRKYAEKIYGVKLSRESTLEILQELFVFMTQYLGGFFQGENYLVGPKGTVKEKFRLSMDIWTMYPHSDGDILYRCDTCGCETHLDTHGVCTTTKCGGTMVKMTFAEARDKDRYYKTVYQEEALPIDIEEHTAQLSSKKARQVQSEFIKGDVNVLSCTTTFELGVDVGDLRAIFMRNVPPTAANYTQRAGRVGRRAGKPGFAITFARLRPHDIAHFDNPEIIISGETKVPICHLDNDAIAVRHVFAVAMSEFFRYARQNLGEDYSHVYNDFMDLSVEEPNGLQELRDYLASKPESIRSQLFRIIPQDCSVSDEIGVESWKWVSKLVSPIEPEGRKDGGRLPFAHSLKHADFERLQEGIERNKNVNDRLAANLLKSRDTLRKERTISILAENGILPKYGFPTDLVELHLPEMRQTVEEDRLSLARGMRQAIREYAPGSEIVAGKTLWKSIGINRPKGQELQVRRYGKCPECGTFVWPIENYDNEGECPVCHSRFKLEKKMLVPSYGFIGKSNKKGIGLRRPRSRGHASVYFSQHWPNEAVQSDVRFPGGLVRKRYAGNGQLCVLNAPRLGFQVCTRCGGAAIGGEEIEHIRWCKESGLPPRIENFSALGTSFVSDVLELVFDIDSAPSCINDDWESVMWALFTAAAKILDAPETELGGTLYENETHGISLLIFDDVPGGAGYARQLSERVPELVEEAYRVVDGHCGCSEETCCYGCIANYYNQTRQAKLSRGAAKKLLGALLFAPASNPAESSTAQRNGEAFKLDVSQDGPSLGALSLAEVLAISVYSDASEEWRELLQGLAELCSQSCREVPDKDVEVFGPNNTSAYASLVWRKAKVMLLNEEDASEFDEEFGTSWHGVANWSIFVVGACTAENIAQRLIEEA